MSHALASEGACNPILQIHVVVNWQLSKEAIHWPASQGHIVGSGVNPLRLRAFLSYPLLVFNLLQAQLLVDFFAMVTNLFFEVDYKFINGSFAFSLG